jgi:hypothetical protein
MYLIKKLLSYKYVIYYIDIYFIYMDSFIYVRIYVYILLKLRGGGQGRLRNAVIVLKNTTTSFVLSSVI